MNKKLKKFLIVLIALVFLEIIYIFSAQKDVAINDIKQIISEQASRIKDPIKKDVLTIRLALNAYTTEHGGKMPESLSLLVPKYLVTIPINPETKKAYEYRLENNKPIIQGSDEIFNSSKKVGVAVNKHSNLTDETKKELIDSLEDNNENFKYDSKGKRDPFVKYDASKNDKVKKGNTPLEQYDISQLKLTAIVSFGDQPKAIIEDISGKGFVAEKGTKVGVKGGIITDIVDNKVIITETTVDFTGKETVTTKEMTLKK